MQWESPASDGGVGINTYTLTGAGSATLTVPSNGPLTTILTLSYNEMYMVSITASNCAGESTASVVTIQEGMRLIIYTIIIGILCVHVSAAFSWLWPPNSSTPWIPGRPHQLTGGDGGGLPVQPRAGYITANDVSMYG